MFTTGLEKFPNLNFGKEAVHRKEQGICFQLVQESAAIFTFKMFHEFFQPVKENVLAVLDVKR